jgi:hypothetical protein
VCRLERNRDPPKYVFSSILEQLTIPSVRLPHTRVNLSLYTSQIEGRVKDEDRVIYHISSCVRLWTRARLRQTPAA